MKPNKKRTKLDKTLSGYSDLYAYAFAFAFMLLDVQPLLPSSLILIQQHSRDVIATQPRTDIEPCGQTVAVPTHPMCATAQTLSDVERCDLAMFFLNSQAGHTRAGVGGLIAGRDANGSITATGIRA